MGDWCDDENDNKGCKKPVDEELYEWKLEDIEPNVDIELRIFDSEIFPISEKDPVLPAPSCAYSKKKSK